MKHLASLSLIPALVAASALSACGGSASLPIESGYGANPTLPEPKKSLIPVVEIAKAKGWPANGKPIAAEGATVAAFAQQLEHPRWLCVLPDGGVLVAETNAPPKPEDEKGLKARIQKMVMKRAGAGVPSANRLTLLVDSDGDGIADQRSVYLENLNSPFGMAVVGDSLYVANTDAVLRFPYVAGARQITEPGRKIVDLPAGPRNHHWTKNLIASADGSKLYVTTGSNSNVGENGMEAEKGRAEIWEVDIASGESRAFATGLRNPNGLAWEPTSGELWTIVNERDEIGSDLVPDYMTSVKDGAFYGWPYFYYGDHADARIPVPDNVRLKAATVPDYALGPHTASLGLAAAKGSSLPAFSEGMFIGQHGSWNRRPRSGYKVIFVPFANGKPNGMPVDVLAGFVNAKGEAQGRPVGVALDGKGALLVADDVGNTIWRVTAAPAPNEIPADEAQPASTTDM
ncbi:MULTISPECIES: PQQ-dependent sugar dehydrogenase [Hydrocarboniphaga]|uniref:Glucose/sorbosone dehydrogenase n=1 Tax=Hydrocarboniphaga effusa AP103 TaxID=1172194 RepID=I7ZA74_9GAMM|nr:MULTISPECIES: sorbosone dehydrogenase family protein [Hydrocarboniphaga]EIT68552.1 glucose/sorbosone dehydrogenase [Hydrocarboniphaga effusa AP103]MDZ4077097.1 sorbosone dehydrogenase family protein [Hydrocarboniphaga sp.]